MKRPGAVSIRSKLIWLTTAISIAAIIVVTAVTTWHAYQSRRDALEQELTAVAGILAANLEASLLFGDRRAAAETLSTLASRPLVIYARLFEDTGAVFAEHGTRVRAREQDWPAQGFREADEFALVTFDVVRNGQSIGKLQLRASLSGLEAAVRQILVISGAVMIGAAVIAWLLARQLGRTISRPIEHLAATMQKVSVDRDFARRAVRTSDDEIGTLIDGFNDMIETIQRSHDDLAEALDRAEHSSRSKSRFLANMSHELRTPLNAIMGFSEIIREAAVGDLPKTYQAYGSDIHGSARYLLSLINDLLELARVDNEGYLIREEVIAVAALVWECDATVRPQAGAKAIALDTALEVPDLLVRADEIGLRQVVLNLVGNAIKFTPSGGRVAVRCFLDEAGDFVISVEDNGPGIAEEDLGRVMEPFEQVRSHLSREHDGTGLGLTISRSIIEAHGGTLTLRTAPGEGTTVRAVLPSVRVT